VERLEGAALRTLYYETEPVLTGGFSEVNRAKRVAMAQAEFAPS
jgi:[protein-PII] uridylyltransferase